MINLSLSFQLNISSDRDRNRGMSWIDDEFEKRERDERKQAHRREMVGPRSQELWDETVSVLKRDSEQLGEKLHSEIKFIERSKREIRIYKPEYPWATEINVEFHVGSLIAVEIIQKKRPCF